MASICGKSNQERYYPYYKFLRLIKESINWTEILKKYKVPEEILEEFSDVIDFSVASQYQELSETFILNHINKVDWDKISAFQQLSETFINNMIEHINLKKIAHCKNKLTDTFIYNHADELDWIQVVKHQRLSEVVLDNFKDKINWSLAFTVQHMTTTFIEHIMREGVLMDWEAISTYRKLDEQFIRKYINKLNIAKVIEYQTLSDEFKAELEAMIEEKKEPELPTDTEDGEGTAESGNEEEKEVDPNETEEEE